jgi:hypothetical protein
MSGGSTLLLLQGFTVTTGPPLSLERMNMMTTIRWAVLIFAGSMFLLSLTLLMALKETL